MSKEINFGNTKGARMARGEKLTNFEKIKAMSVDEMAEFLFNSDQICFDTCKKATGDKNKCPFKMDGDVLKHCFGCYLKWVNSEVSDTVTQS